MGVRGMRVWVTRSRKASRGLECKTEGQDTNCHGQGAGKAARKEGVDCGWERQGKSETPGTKYLGTDARCGPYLRWLGWVGVTYSSGNRFLEDARAQSGMSRDI